MKGKIGFYKRRRGILEHLEAGTINLVDLAVHDYLNLKANLVIGSQSSIPPGVCVTSATAIHAVCPGRISEKAIQRSLQHLEQIGWIKRWNVRGEHGNYPVLVCRASVHDLSGKEYRINGDATTDWRNPKWTPVGDASTSGEIAGELLSVLRENRIERREKKKNLAPAAPAHPRYKRAFDSCFEAYRTKFGADPTWGGREGKALKHFLDEHASIPAEEIGRRYGYFLESTDRYHAEKHGSLVHLLSNFDVFADGPLQRPARSNLDGKTKVDPEQRSRDNLRAAGLLN